MKRWLASLFVAVAASTFAQGVADPAHIEVYVTPYYNSTGPTIEVGRFSKGLAAKSEPEFVATIAKMKQSWNELRYPEVYAAAIRLYDLGFRKESIYWFYSAQYRGRLFATLVDREKMGSIGAPAFELVQAANAFQQLVGPYINGYAFGDTDLLAQIITRVQNENRTIADLEKIYPGVAFKPRSQWPGDNADLNDGLTKLLTILKDQKASLKKTRGENGTEAKFAKLTSKDLPGTASTP
jgi:hypothetical protein